MSKRAMTKDAPKEAPKEMPKKPLNFYMQFRANRMKELEGKDNRTEIIKEEWANIAPEVKEAENAKQKKEVEKYNALMAEWKKAHPNEARSKRRKTGDDDDDEEKEEEKKEEKPKGKGDKANGAPKAERGAKKEEPKEEKGKSKGKKEERGESKKPKK